MKLISWPKNLTRDFSVRNPIGDQPGVGPCRRRSNPGTLPSPPTMIRSQGDSNLCASISVSNVLSYALRRYLLEENVIPGSFLPDFSKRALLNLNSFLKVDFSKFRLFFQ